MNVAFAMGDPQPFFAFTYDSLSARAFNSRNLPNAALDSHSVVAANPATTSNPMDTPEGSSGNGYPWPNVPVTVGNPLVLYDYSGSFAYTFGLSTNEPGESPSDWHELSGWGWLSEKPKVTTSSSELLLTLPAAVNPVPFPGSAMLAGVGLTCLALRGVVRRLRGA